MLYWVKITKCNLDNKCNLDTGYLSFYFIGFIYTRFENLQKKKKPNKTVRFQKV